MNWHLTIKTPCFSVEKLRNSPAKNSVLAYVLRLESKYFNYNLLDSDLIRVFHCCPGNYERYGLQTFAEAVCRMDAAFERTWMCSQRVSVKVCNSCLELCGQLHTLRMSLLRAVVCKVNRTAVRVFPK